MLLTQYFQTFLLEQKKKRRKKGKLILIITQTIYSIEKSIQNKYLHDCEKLLAKQAFCVKKKKK